MAFCIVCSDLKHHLPLTMLFLHTADLCHYNSEGASDGGLNDTFLHLCASKRSTICRVVLESFWLIFRRHEKSAKTRQSLFSIRHVGLILLAV
ncbi:hypothetical protein CEXT_447541 [Caerostris extrusa]|uniref:Secreted protein n=1 Tax=Caerostris extrusa TaxID=172846 RepID=A0AAV4N3Y4_CAEEX|nr:hypothetical protein CEXT_447541 [Caerostris extrusa]